MPGQSPWPWDNTRSFKDDLRQKPASKFKCRKLKFKGPISAAPAILPISPQSQLRLEHVSLKTPGGFSYLLQDISFEVFQGDRLGIVGASGSGKTSLLRVLNRLVEINQGQFFFENQDIRQIPPVQLRQQITLVPQESKLLGMTVRQALAYPLSLRGIDRRVIEQRVQSAMEQLHLPSDWLERTEAQLSVGQRQLVAIARALIIQPKVLLLDEPTSALDAGRGDHLLNVLQALAQATSTTILIVSHDLELVQQFCSQLLYLRQGQLTQSLSVDQVNWLALKQALIDEQTEAAEEWT